MYKRQYIRLAFVKKKLFDNYEALDDDDMDDAAKTETEDKVLSLIHI